MTSPSSMPTRWNNEDNLVGADSRDDLGKEINWNTGNSSLLRSGIKFDYLNQFGNNSEHMEKILVIWNLMLFYHPAKLRQLLRVEPDLAEEGGHHCHRQCSLERASGENK